MISRFKIRNFRSILDMVVDFNFAERKAPNRYRALDSWPFLETGGKTRLSPCLALFGANASGKTNVIRAMHAFKYATTDKAIAYYEPNKLHYNETSTLFELTIHLKGNVFVYTIDYNDKEICKEELTKEGKTLYVINHLKGLFSDGIKTNSYNAKKLQSILDVECSDGNGHQTISLLSRVGKQYQGLNRDLQRIFNYIDSGILVFPNNDIPFPESLDNLKKLYNGDEEKALGEIVKLVRMLDIDIKKMQVKHESVDNLQQQNTSAFYRKLPKKDQYEVYNVWTFHADTLGKLIPFNFLTEESEGTHRLAGLVGMMLFCLKGGYTIFLDELDCSLHPLLTRELIRLFKDKRYNTNGAQLVFTTHNTDILDDDILRLSEVAIVRKTLQSGTIIKRIVDFKEDGQDIRNVTNFRKQYLKGFYSGIPYPAI